MIFDILGGGGGGGGFRKNILLGMKILWMFFWGHYKIGLYLGVISMHFKVFSPGSRYRIGDIFGVAKISNII